MTRDPADQRRFHRILFDTEATLSSPRGHWVTRLVDISLNGALVIVPPGWDGRRGDRFALSVPLDNDTVIRMETEIVHESEDVIGLHCRHIDLESVGWLRRLVELNLADMDLLERDLTALIRGGVDDGC